MGVKAQTFFLTKNLNTMELTLERTYLKKGVNSILTFKKKSVCYCIELPWLNNLKNISCIPEGRYKLAPRYSERFKQHWELLNVQNRSAILIHPANNASKELRGCIAPVTKLTGEGIGSESVRAMLRIQELLATCISKNETHYITIKKLKK